MLAAFIMFVYGVTHQSHGYCIADAFIMGYFAALHGPGSRDF